MNRCAFPVIDSENRARGCGAPATTTRTTCGVELDACDLCAANLDTNGPEAKARREAPPAPEPIDAKARARFEARQAKLPPHKRRTWEQACADDDADLKRALHRAGKRGGL